MASLVVMVLLIASVLSADATCSSGAYGNSCEAVYPRNQYARDIAVSPCRRYVVSVLSSEYAVMWSPQDASFSHDLGVVAPQGVRFFTAYGYSVLVTSNPIGNVIFWVLGTNNVITSGALIPTIVRTLPMGFSPVDAPVAVTSNGNVLVTGYDKVLRVYTLSQDAQTGLPVLTETQTQSMDDEIISVSVSSDGARVAAAYVVGVRSWVVSGWTEQAHYTTPGVAMYQVDFVPESMTYAVLSSQGVHIVYDATAFVHSTLLQHSLATRMSVSATRVAALSHSLTESTVHVSELSDGVWETTRTEVIGDQHFGGGTFFGADRYVTCSNTVCVVYLLDKFAYAANEGCGQTPIVATHCPRIASKHCALYVRHACPVAAVSYSHDSAHIAYGSGRAVRVLDVATKTLRGLGCANFVVRDVAFSQDASLLAVGGDGGRMVVCDVATGARKYDVLSGGDRPVSDVSFDVNGCVLSGNGENGGNGVHVFCPPGVPAMYSAVGQYAGTHISAARASGTHSLLASGTDVDSEHMRVWSNTQFMDMAKEGEVVAFDFSPAASPVLVYGHRNGTVCMRSITLPAFVPTPETVVYTMPSAHLNDLRYSPKANDHKVAVAGFQEVVLVDVFAGTEVATFLGHTQDVHRIAYAHNGLTLATAGDDGALFVWNVPQ